MAKVDQFTEGVRGDSSLLGYPTPVCNGCEHFFNKIDTSGCTQIDASKLPRIKVGSCEFKVEKTFPPRFIPLGSGEGSS